MKHILLFLAAASLALAQSFPVKTNASGAVTEPANLLVSGAFGGTGVINSGKTLTLGGNFATSGAFGLVLTLTGNTTVTLPTSGTLSTLAGAEVFTNKSISLANNTLTATSAQLATAVTDETGTGALVFANTPTLVTPNIGAATGTSVNLSGAGTFGGNLTVSGGTLTSGGNSGATLALSGNGSSGFRVDMFSGASGSASNTTYYNTTAAGAGNASYGRIGLLSNTSNRDMVIDTGSNGTGTAGNIAINPSGGILSTSGNLTVSGTGTSSFAGNVGIGTTTPDPTSAGGRVLTLSGDFTRSRFQLRNTDGTSVGSVAGTIQWLAASTGLATIDVGSETAANNAYMAFSTAVSGTVAEAMRIAASTRNFLIGTTTDGGQKLQVNGTAYVSGDATFAGQLNILSANSYLKSDASNLVYETYAGKGHQFKTGGTTALTLDSSSQNATFAGTVTIPKCIAAGSAGLSSTRFGIYFGGTLSGSTDQIAIVSAPTFDSSAVNLAAAGYFAPTTANSSFTAGAVYGLYVASTQKGAASTITTNYGLRIFDQASGATNYAIYTGSGLVRLGDTTASTSTSTGALVVSGGVGVAGAINAGGSLVINPLHTVARKIEAQIAHSVSTEDYLRVSSNSGTTNTYGGEFGYGLTAAGSPEIRFNRVHAGTITNWLTVPTSTGNLLIGTTTDGGQKLQVNGTAYVSGDATFAGFILNRTNNKGVYTGTSDNCGFTWTGTNGEFSTASGSLILKSAGTTALTLDSSQRTIANGVFWSSSNGNTSTNGFNNATAIANNLISLYGSTGSANIQIAGRVSTFDGGSGYYGLKLQAPTSAYPDFSGTVNWTDALTLTSQNATFAGRVTTTQVTTASGTTASTATGTAVTLFTLSGTQGLFIVHAYLGVDDASNYAAFATVVMDGTAARIVSNNATLMSITLSGSSVQATQGSGTNQTIKWKYTRM